MSQEKIIRNCAPTLAGIKTANLFNEYFDNKNQLLEDIRKFNKSFAKNGVRMTLINIVGNRALIYVFRVSDLKHDLNHGLSKNILTEYGYDSSNIYTSIKLLCEKVVNEQTFPHEIGLFLGYPAEDVKGFIDNKGANYKAFGTWKVYGDLNKAQKTFHSYQTCCKTWLDKFKKGTTLSQLVIAK